MRVIDLMTVLSDCVNTELWYNGEMVSEYNGRDSYLPEYLCYGIDELHFDRVLQIKISPDGKEESPTLADLYRLTDDDTYLRVDYDDDLYENCDELIESPVQYLWVQHGELVADMYN